MSMVACGRRLKVIHMRLFSRWRSFKFPEETVVTTIDESLLPSCSKIDDNTVEHLERLSLVNFANKRGVERLEEAVKFAGSLSVIDTSGVEPLYSVLENEILRLREDEVTDGANRNLVMASSMVTEEDYYVAPPGNIPLDPKDLSGSS